MSSIVLSDPLSGAQATILPELGFNCYQFHCRHNDTVVELLWSEPGFEAGDRKASGSGIPLLFPFPGRIAGRIFEWEGQSYELEAGDGRGNAIHGFAHTRPWRVVEQTQSRAAGQFQPSLDAPEVLNSWPTDFRTTAAYELAGETLKAAFTLENPSDRPLPCGFGVHPYFRVPLAGEDASDCRVRLPVKSQWELRDMLTTGKRLPVENPDEFREGLSFAEMRFDHVFSGLEFEGEFCTATIQQAAVKLATVLRFDRLFRDCVVYTPAHRQAICIEPYTCPPDPFRLTRQGADAGLIVLAPSESRRGVVEIELAPVVESIK